MPLPLVWRRLRREATNVRVMPRHASVGQLQLLQPFFGLILAGLPHEPIAWTMIVTTIVVVLCVAGAKRFTLYLNEEIR